MQIAKFPAYLSPSSLNAFEKMPATFYLQRMAPDPWPYSKSGVAAAVGSAFDAQCKVKFAKDRARVLDTLSKGHGWKDVTGLDFYDALIKLNVAEEFEQEARAAGAMLWQTYEKALAWQPLVLDDVEVWHNFILFGPRINVPLFMKLDGVHKTCPMDWKTTGYGRATGGSLKPGYRTLIDKGLLSKPHKLFREGMGFDEFNEQWATQMCIYGWGLGKPLYKPFDAYIHALCIRPTGVRVAFYVGVITEAFQRQVVKRLEDAWIAIHEAKFLPDNRIAIELMAEGEKFYG